MSEEIHFKIIEESKNKIIFEIDLDIGLCHLVKEELYNDKDVSVASVKTEHPELGKPKFIVEAKDPKKAIQNAIKRLQKKIDSFKKEAKKLK